MFGGRKKSEKILVAVEALKVGDRSEAVKALHAIPRPPLLAREPVFFGDAYAAFVKERRNNLRRAEMKRRLRLQQSGAVDDLSSSDGEVLAGESLKEYQKNWLRIIHMVAFINSRRLAKKMWALEKLRLLLLPIIVKRLSRRRLEQRMQKIKILLLAQMTPLKIEDLLHLEAFLGWDKEHVADALAQFVPLAVSANTTFVSEGEVGGHLYILDQGRVRTCKRVPPGREILVMALQGKRNLSDILKSSFEVINSTSVRGTCFNQLSVLQGSPSYVSFRSCDSGRTLVWYIDSRIYDNIRQRHRHPDFAKKQREALDKLRCDQMLLANPPTTQSLRNCLRNATFACWPEKQLQQLVSCLKPVALRPGEVLLDSSDAVLGNRVVFIASGVVLATIKTGNDASATVTVTLGPWTCIGADGIVVNERKSFILLAKSDVDAYMCGKEDIQQLHNKDPSLLMQSRQGICEQREREMPRGAAIAQVMPHVLQALTRDPAIRTFPDAVIERLCAAAVPVWLPPNEQILSPTIRASIFVIASGVCRAQRVSLNPSTAALEADLNLRSGAVLGTLSVTLELPFPFSVTTRSVVEAYVISPDALAAALRPTSKVQPDYLQKLRECCTVTKNLQVITLPAK